MHFSHPAETSSRNNARNELLSVMFFLGHPSVSLSCALQASKTLARGSKGLSRAARAYQGQHQYEGRPGRVDKSFTLVYRNAKHSEGANSYSGMTTTFLSRQWYKSRFNWIPHLLPFFCRAHRIFGNFWMRFLGSDSLPQLYMIDTLYVYLKKIKMLLRINSIIAN